MVIVMVAEWEGVRQMVLQSPSLFVRREDDYGRS
jgi:hypothetical protein